MATNSHGICRYVEDGRNPDIYTREFVEIVAKQNQIMNGKMRAFADFRDTLAAQINSAFPELREDVERVLQETSPSERKRAQLAVRTIEGETANDSAIASNGTA